MTGGCWLQWVGELAWHAVCGHWLRHCLCPGAVQLAQQELVALATTGAEVHVVVMVVEAEAVRVAVAVVVAGAELEL